MTPAPVWEEEFGLAPYKVWVYERAEKRGVLYLRWRHEGNWRKESLGQTLRTADGRVIIERQKAARLAAKQKYALLASCRTTIEAPTPAPAGSLTIADGLAAAIHPKTGKYHVDTTHRRELIVSMGHAARVWGADTPWAAIRKAQIRDLWRTRLHELKAKDRSGARGAEITVARVLAVAAWLRGEELIPLDACVAPKNWKGQLAGDWQALHDVAHAPEPNRPRHTLDEMRKILAAAAAVDPRFDLLMALGAELRLGQVVRARRADLNIETWTFRVRANKHKKGTLQELTPGQVRAVERALDPETGYLRELERHAVDYALFPAGQLPGGRSGHGVATVARHLEADPVDRTAIRGWFQAAERLAEVVPVKGRGAYGLRRAAVDAVKALGISREGLKAHGGWVDTQMPDMIYADQEAEAGRGEARTARAKIRGEVDE
jgi:integrase